MFALKHRVYSQTCAALRAQSRRWCSSQHAFDSHWRRERAAQHVQTSGREKLGLALSAAPGALLDPLRHDLVAMLGEVTGTPALAALRRRMAAHTVGKRILQEKPRIRMNTIDLEECSRLPANTFGAAYAMFMNSHGYSPDDRAPVRYVDDPDLAYIMCRYRETHDFAHCLFALPPTVLGELALKWIELAQNNLPMNALAAFAGPLRLGFGPEAIHLSKGLRWAVGAGRRAELLLNVYFEEELETDLDELRQKLRITKAPEFLREELTH